MCSNIVHPLSRRVAHVLLRSVQSGFWQNVERERMFRSWLNEERNANEYERVRGVPFTFRSTFERVQIILKIEFESKNEFHKPARPTSRQEARYSLHRLVFTCWHTTKSTSPV